MTHFNRVVVVAVLFCALLPFSARAYYEIVIDPTAENDNDFYLQTTLAGALQSIMSGSYLYYYDWVITLSDNCVNTTQYFTTDNSEIYGSGSYYLTIQYISPYSAVAQASDCSQLPTVVIGPNSQLQFSIVGSLILQGLNIQYSGDPSLYSYIYEINQVIFSNICFNNSEPTEALPSGYVYTYFEIDYIYNFTINNMVFLSDAIKYLWFTDVQNLTIANLTHVILPWTTLNYYAPFYSSTYSYTNTAISMSSVQYVCNPSSDIMNYLMVLTYFETLTLTDVTFVNCNFIPSEYDATSLVVFRCGTSVTIDGVNATNVTIQTSASSSTSVGTSAVSLFDIRSAQTIQLSNFILSNVSVGTSFLGIYDDTCTLSSAANIAIEGWIITESKSFNSANFIQLLFSYYSYINTWSLDNFTTSGTSFNASGLIYISFSYTSSLDSLNNNLVIFNVSNTELTNCTFEKRCKCDSDLKLRNNIKKC